MATDLSKIIPENLSSTLNALLAKETKLLECTKVDPRDFTGSELLRVDVEFVFDKIATHLSYYIPAQSASRIFNIMMGMPDGDILSKIDEDTADAMSEFISNACGGLVTIINAQNYEDLRKAKFNFKHKEICKGDEISSFENSYRFAIDIEEQLVTIFLTFAEDFTPFISDLTTSSYTFYPEEEKIEKIENTQEEVKKDEETEEESLEDLLAQKKKKKLRLLIIIVGGILALVIVAAIIFYILGGFDQEEEPKKADDINTTQVAPPPVKLPQYEVVKKNNFKPDQINTQRLASKLELLTKYQVLTQEQLEAQALEEKRRIIKLKKEELLIEFAQQNKEEPLVIPQKTEPSSPQEIQKQEIEKQEIQKIETNQEKIEPKQEIASIEKISPKLKFVLANSVRYSLFKELVLKTASAQARISICSDPNNKTQILIGPFESEVLQVELNSLIRESDSTIETTIINITQEQFDARCNF